VAGVLAAGLGFVHGRMTRGGLHGRV